MGLREDPLLLNLAHACYQASDTANAAYYYQRTASSADPVLRSVAQSQLGVLEQQRQEYPAALERFRQALLSHPGNEEARYNYELLKKLMEQQQENQQDQKEEQNQEQQQQQQQQQKDQQQDSKDQEQQDQQDHRAASSRSAKSSPPRTSSPRIPTKRAKRWNSPRLRARNCSGSST
jgi:Ca-activated chloride channel homolog